MDTSGAEQRQGCWSAHSSSGRYLDALRCQDNSRRRNAGAERRQGRLGALSGSGRSTRHRTGTTVDAALPERNGGRAAVHRLIRAAVCGPIPAGVSRGRAAVRGLVPAGAGRGRAAVRWLIRAAVCKLVQIERKSSEVERTRRADHKGLRRHCEQRQRDEPPRARRRASSPKKGNVQEALHPKGVVQGDVPSKESVWAPPEPLEKGSAHHRPNPSRTEEFGWRSLEGKRSGGTPPVFGQRSRKRAARTPQKGKCSGGAP